MSSDITRNDLLVVRWCDREDGHHADHADHYEPPTDEEFDRLAREAGYISVQRLIDGHVDMLTLFPQSLSESGKRKLLRALLTDECDGRCAPHTGADKHAPDCRGWLPKDGVEVTESYVEDYLGGSGITLHYMPDEPGKRFYVIPADLVEGEDEK